MIAVSSDRKMWFHEIQYREIKKKPVKCWSPLYCFLPPDYRLGIFANILQTASIWDVFDEMVPGMAVCCVAIANTSCSLRIHLSGPVKLIFFFPQSIIRPGSYFMNGRSENLEQLHPLGTDCARAFEHHSPHFERSVLIINILLKNNDILEHKIAYFLILFIQYFLLK